MQAQTIPISINTANASPAPARGPAADGAEEASTPFREALSREIGQRQQAGDAAAEVPAPEARSASGTKRAAQATEAAADAAQAAIAADAAAIDPITDMLALAATIAQPAQPADAAPAAPEHAATAPLIPAGKMGTDPIYPLGKMGTDPISPTGNMETDPVSGFATVREMTQPQPDGGPQLRSMFATALAQTPQAPDTAAADVAAQPGQARATLQPVPAAPARPSELPQELASLAAPGGETVTEAPATEAPAQNASFATQLQAARTEQVQASVMAGGDRLAARVGTPAWDKQLGQKIVFMAAGAEQSASLILNPPDLGPVQVVLNITNDQASVAFSSAQLDVRQALENAMPKLREMMGESGITLGNATVNAGMPEQQQQAQRGQDARAGGNHGNGRGNGGGAGGDDAAPAVVTRRVSNGVVDTFA